MANTVCEFGMLSFLLVMESYISDVYDELCKDMAKELNMLIVSVE